MKTYSIVLIFLLLMGCADGRIDVLDTNGNVIGECSARFYWHWHGAQDSVNYMLYICAKEHLANGYLISDDSILKYDYTLPVRADAEAWNKLNAYEAFKSGIFNEQKYGYLLAAIEFEHTLKTRRASEQLRAGKIDEKTYANLLKKAKLELEGE